MVNRKKDKDPSMGLLNVHVMLEAWMVRLVKELNLNLSEEVRTYLRQRLPKTKVIELEEMKMKKQALQSELAGVEATIITMGNDLELIKEQQRQKFLEDNLDAFVLKKGLMLGTIPQDNGIFVFPDRDVFVADVKSGKIKAHDPIQAFKAYRFRVTPTKTYADARYKLQMDFEQWLKTSDVQIETKKDGEYVD